ncbi:Clp protease N-terminal domain-containing protein [Actinocrispum wychmicini]|uniref:Clp protease N-terminal domain-containing protein n=1 Tax=Actinocrispum wychmicini TaxID=1213861 RepID=UPI001405271E|nr:Clp protease N-terminal domain-containing protein [Actinocrispum wychmicini]
MPLLVKAAQTEAQALGAKAIEAEHLLLAIAAQPDSPVGQTLHRFGLLHDRLIDLIGGERARSLAFIGIDPASVGLPSTPKKTRGRLPLATSSKQALARVVENSNRRRDKLNVAELLRAIVGTDAGTVARLLAMANVDRADLINHLEGREL